MWDTEQKGFHPRQTRTPRERALSSSTRTSYDTPYDTSFDAHTCRDTSSYVAGPCVCRLRRMHLRGRR